MATWNVQYDGDKLDVRPVTAPVARANGWIARLSVGELSVVLYLTAEEARTIMAQLSVILEETG